MAVSAFDTQTSSPLSTTGDSASAPTTGTDAAATSTGAGTGADTDTVACGDGSRDDGEACDDGNLVNGDGCNKDCTASASLVWEYRSGSPAEDGFHGVAASPDGRIFAVGAQVMAGDQDRWIAEFQDGGVVASTTYDRGLREAHPGPVERWPNVIRTTAS